MEDFRRELLETGGYRTHAEFDTLSTAMGKVCRVLLFLISVAGMTVAQGANDGINGEVDRTDPNFVIVSLGFADPGRELFSCAGHTFIRLECPTYKLDYCFSYEGEAVNDKILAFFADKLKMGMYAIPTADYLAMYKAEGRGVRQYRLNMPPEAKQRLWKIMDDLVKKGADLPYDYIKRGCAWSVLRCLMEALNPLQFEIGSWPERYRGHQRAIIASALDDYPWTRFAIHAIVGADVDKDIPNIRKVVVPRDFLEFMRGVKIKGVPVLAGEAETLLPSTLEYSAPIITPMAAAILFLLLAVANFFIRKPYLDWLFLGLQSAAGLFFCYLVCFSSLPATTWNWLIVPFNLLPLVFWRWRRYWAWPFAAVLVAWEALMIFYPHQLTDWAYVVIVAAYIVFYAKQGRVWTTARAG